MTTEIIQGKGNLYHTYDQKFIATVSYKIFEGDGTDGNAEKWWGELTVIDNVRIADGDRYYIELENHRKGRCSLRRRVNKAVIMVPPRYFYQMQGSGPLE